MSINFKSLGHGVELNTEVMLPVVQLPSTGYSNIFLNRQYPLYIVIVCLLAFK